MKPATILIIISFLLTANITKAQTKSQLTEILETTYKHEHKHYSIDKNAQNEYQLVISAMFTAYKRFISSQDASSCSFSPSCSEYAVIAINQQGLFWGIINFFDRFSRCTGMSPEQYQFDDYNHLLIDPVLNSKYKQPAK